MMQTTHIQIIDGAVKGRNSAPSGASGHPAKRWYARHDKGRPVHNPNTHTCRAVESLAEQDEDVRYELTPKPLDQVKSWARQAIDEMAFDAMAGLSNPSHEQKAREVYSYLELVSCPPGIDPGSWTTPTPEPAKFPALAARIGLDGETMADVVQTVTTRMMQTDAKRAAIDKARGIVKAAVAQCSAVDQIAAYVDQARAAIQGA